MQNKIFVPRFYEWPDIVYADCIEQDGEFAFVPISQGVDTKVEVSNGAYDTTMWSYELGPPEKATDFWETERPDCFIWVDFSNS